MSVRGRARTLWVLYFDGALRVNHAGPPGIGAVLKNSYGHVVATIKKCVDSNVSQNVAEYLALIAGLEKAKWLNVQHLVAKGDSLLVYNQVITSKTFKRGLTSPVAVQSIPLFSGVPMDSVLMPIGCMYSC